jgi:hypothetical protein
MQTPNGHRVVLGTDTESCISAEGNVEINPETGTIKANKLLVMGSEKQGETFRKFTGDLTKAALGYVTGGVLKTGIGAWKGVGIAKQVTKRTGLKEAGATNRAQIGADVEKTRINAEAATAQAEIGAQAQ